MTSDRVIDLINRTYVYLNVLFYDILFDIINNNPLPELDIKWEKKPYTKKDLDKLSMLSRNMDEAEINKRIRATTFNKKFGPYYID